MGCWNGSCFVTNLPIFFGEPVEVLLLRNDDLGDNSSVHPNDDWTPYKFTFHGNYDDYGSVEECAGPAIPILVKAIKDNLVELPAKTSEYNGKISIVNKAVKREGLDIDNLLDYEQDDRLFVSDAGLGSFKTNDAAVKHVTVHKRVYQLITANFEFEVSARMKIGKPIYDEDWAPRIVNLHNILDMYDDFVNDPTGERAGYVREMVTQYNGYSSPYFPPTNREDPMDRLKSYHGGFVEEIIAKDRSLFENAARLAVFNIFMMRGRRSYTIPSGAGSQDSSYNAQQMVADMIGYQIEKIKEREKEYANDDE